MRMSKFMRISSDADPELRYTSSNKLFDLSARNDFLDNEFCANVIGIENNSPYFELDEYLNYNRMAAASGNRYIITLFLNIRSMNANFSEFIEDFCFEKTEYDFLNFTETRLTDDVVSLYRMETIIYL